MCPWTHSTGSYFSMSASRFDAKAGFQRLFSYQGRMHRGLGAWWVMTRGVRPSSRGLAEFALDEGAVFAMAPRGLLRGQ